MKNEQLKSEFIYVRHTGQANINNIKFQETRDCILTQSTDSGSDMSLTIDILDASAPALMADSCSMEAVYQSVQRWREENRNDYAEIAWQIDLIQFAVAHSDIAEIYATEKDIDGCEFVIIMDDVTNSHVFDYNEFCFQFSEKYEKVTDFMVIDVEEAQGCHDLLSTYSIIYSRG